MQSVLVLLEGAGTRDVLFPAFVGQIFVVVHFTEEEISVLQLMLEGHSTSFMTQTLEMDPGEIAANAASAYEKLGVVEQTYGDRISSAVQVLVSQAT